MTRPDESVTTNADEAYGTKSRWKWAWPDHIGRLRTSTVVLVVAFLGTALLRSYFMALEENTTTREETAVPVPVETTSQQIKPTTTVPTTTPPTSTAEPGSATETTQTPTSSPLIVLPPGLVPSGVELPPGVAVETTTTPAAPTATPPTTTATP
jgi:hypothetical protein